jgi:hypothetical protein
VVLLHQNFVPLGWGNINLQLIETKRYKEKQCTFLVHWQCVYAVRQLADILISLIPSPPCSLGLHRFFHAGRWLKGQIYCRINVWNFIIQCFGITVPRRTYHNLDRRRELATSTLPIIESFLRDSIPTCLRPWWIYWIRIHQVNGPHSISGNRSIWEVQHLCNHATYSWNLMLRLFIENWACHWEGKPSFSVD